MDDHRVFKRWRPSLEDGQKWGVYSCPSLTELESHNNDGSECQSPETTHFCQGRRLRQTCKTNKICARRQGQNARQCTKPDTTYDHAMKAVTKHTCDNFKLAYTGLHYNAERMWENYAILNTSHSEDTIPVRLVWLHQPQMYRTYNIGPVKKTTQHVLFNYQHS